MIVKLPDGSTEMLENNVCIERKIEIVDELIERFQEYIDGSWDKYPVKYFLDGLSNYLVWHKEEEEKYKHDKYVLSRKRTKEMKKFMRRDVNFSNLSIEEKVRAGE